MDAKQEGHLSCPECGSQQPKRDGIGAHCPRCGWKGLVKDLQETAKTLKGNKK